MPSRLNNSGNSFRCRFERTGDLIDISNAISAQQRAVHLTPDGHADMPDWLNNLGISFRCRFEHTGDLPDISSAMLVQQRAISLTPDGDAEIPRRLNNLGNSLLCRFVRTQDLSDISSAISAQQKAIALTPDDHADLPAQLSNLGTSFHRRFQRTGDLPDISSAISTLQRAVRLTPDDHAGMPFWLANLGNSFRLRFQHAADLPDISEAILAHQRALHLTPNDHADMPGQLSNLGFSLRCSFDHTGDSADIHEAISYYHQSATLTSGAPSRRLNAALQWAKLATSHNPPESLPAYSVAIDLLSQVAGMDRTITQRHTSLVDISSLTSTAASIAFTQGEFGKALEWLEHGRCLVWNQLNQLRTPVDDLRIHDKTLADRFLEVSRALESSGSRQESTIFALDDTILEQIALEGKAHSHIEFAEEWGKILNKIRKISGFHDFLRPPQSSNILRDLPRDGSVVLVNVHKDWCDALVLVPGRDQPLHIPLDHFTYQDASNLKDRLRSYLSLGGYLMRQSDRGPREVLDHGTEETSEIHNILRELWLCVARPILNKLEYSVSYISLELKFSFIYTSIY